MLTPSAAANPSPSLRQRVRALVESPRFDGVIIAVIVANALALGLETFPAVLERHGATLHLVDRVALGVFVLELLLRAFVYRGRFFADAWRVFDFLVVAVAILPSSGVFSILRALRVLRALRLVSLVPSMRKVVAALLRALPGMASILGLMVLVLYVSAVIATKLFGSQAPELFGGLGPSFFTLFQIMTVEGWPDIARQIMSTSPWAWLFFVLYLLIATFMVLNLFIAVVVNAMQEQVVEELRGDEQDHAQLVLGELRALRREIEELRRTTPSA